MKNVINTGVYPQSSGRNCSQDGYNIRRLGHTKASETPKEQPAEEKQAEHSGFRTMLQETVMSPSRVSVHLGGRAKCLKSSKAHTGNGVFAHHHKRLMPQSGPALSQGCVHKTIHQPGPNPARIGRPQNNRGTESGDEDNRKAQDHDSYANPDLRCQRSSREKQDQGRSR
jgi:hypothetical protein